MYRWLRGHVRKTHTWQPLIRAANALSLSKAEADSLLQAAQHPPTDQLLGRSMDDYDRELLARWTVAVPNNLPGRMTSFIGREEEITRAVQLLSSARLVTLTGPGGSGKSRLALETAESTLERFKDGAFFAALAAVRNPELVMPEVARTLGLRESTDRPPLEVLKLHLRQARTLLVLDKFEQVIEAAPYVGQLLRAAPQVKILVTSRARLNLSGERELPVPPLEVPAAGSADRASCDASETSRRGVPTTLTGSNHKARLVDPCKAPRVS